MQPLAAARPTNSMSRRENCITTPGSTAYTEERPPFMHPTFAPDNDIAFPNIRITPEGPWDAAHSPARIIGLSGRRRDWKDGRWFRATRRAYKGNDMYFRLSIVAAAALAASPAAASDLGGGESKVGVFAGGSLRLTLGQGGRPRPQALLQVSGARAYQRPGGGPTFSLLEPKPIELELSSGKPSLLIGGRKSAAVRRKLAMDGICTPLWSLGGVAAAGGLLCLAAEIFDNEPNAEP